MAVFTLRSHLLFLPWFSLVVLPCLLIGLLWYFSFSWLPSILDWFWFYDAKLKNALTTLDQVSLRILPLALSSADSLCFYIEFSLPCDIFLVFLLASMIALGSVLQHSVIARSLYSEDCSGFCFEDKLVKYWLPSNELGLKHIASVF